MRARGATPSITHSPFDDEEEIENVVATMDESGSRKDQTLLKKLCLERDDYRCMATGIIDNDAGTRETFGPKAPTNLCHIIPFSLGKWNKSNVGQLWTMYFSGFNNVVLNILLGTPNRPSLGHIGEIIPGYWAWTRGSQRSKEFDHIVG